MQKQLQSTHTIRNSGGKYNDLIISRSHVIGMHRTPPHVALEINPVIFLDLRIPIIKCKL